MQGVDPVGACVGPRGSRVRMVVSELRGEKIDIIPWNDEPARFVAKALAPAKVREVYVDDAAQQATVVVPDGELSLAIGKEGLNARLAHRLTGWRIDIVSETEHYAEDTDVPYTGAEGEDDEFPGRCIAVTSSGKRCPEPGARRQPLLRRARSSRAGRQGGGSGRVVADPIRQCAGCGRRREQGRTDAAGGRSWRRSSSTLHNGFRGAAPTCVRGQECAERALARKALPRRLRVAAEAAAGLEAADPA